MLTRFEKKQLVLALLLFFSGIGIAVSQTTLIGPANNGDFENATPGLNWTTVNPGSNAIWFCGNTASCNGANGAYIGTAAANNNYNIGTGRVAHIYRDITFPACETNITLTFNWKGNGEATFDHLKVYLVPTTTTPVSGTQLGAAFQVGTEYSMQGATCAAVSITISSALAGNTSAATNRRLVFSWRNDGSVGTMPAASFDDVVLTCSAPVVTAPMCAFAASPVSGGAPVCASAVSLSWTAPSSGSAPTGYQLYLGTDPAATNIVNGTNLGNVTSYNAGALTAGTTYYWYVVPVNCGGSATGCAIQNFVPYDCISMVNGSTTSCGMYFYDPQGSGTNYINNLNVTYTICPSTPGTCVSAAFQSFATEAGFDFLRIYDGNSTAAPQLTGSPFSGTTGPGYVIGTPTNATGCLTFNFTSDGATRAAGWIAEIGCAACGSTAPAFPQDCNGAATVCNDAAFTGNSYGDGLVNDLNNSNHGCLIDNETQTSWYYFSPSAAGTLALNITPANGTDDYDFAIWGPATISCPPSGAPARCSYAISSGTTGLNSSAAGQNSENLFGDGFVDVLTVTAGEQYILVIDNFSGSSSPFTLDWTMSGGASLNCAPLPIELLSLSGMQQDEQIQLNWSTASELNNDYFTVERSPDGSDFSEITKVDGAGISVSTLHYEATDPHPYAGNNYYRLRQTDFDGAVSYSNIINVRFLPGSVVVGSVHPNPTGGSARLEIYLPAENDIIQSLLDYTGRCVYTEEYHSGAGNNILEIPMETLRPGIYTFMLEVPGLGFSKALKIIRQ